MLKKLFSFFRRDKDKEKMHIREEATVVFKKGGETWRKS